jgi:uncharacterized membrane protein
MKPLVIITYRELSYLRRSNTVKAVKWAESMAKKRGKKYIHNFGEIIIFISVVFIIYEIIYK